MFSHTMRRRVLPALRGANSRIQAQAQTQRRTLVRAPKEGGAPLMERRSDRELPSVESLTFRWSRTLPIFAALIAAASLAIFNYQKMSSPIVASTLYSLRTSPRARELLGDQIYFKHQVPWISGTMNQVHGEIDIRFAVRGTKDTAVMRFASHRPGARAMFETTEWSLEMSDGTRVDLLDGDDPFRAFTGVNAMDDDEPEEQPRGFRQQVK